MAADRRSLAGKAEVRLNGELIGYATDVDGRLTSFGRAWGICDWPVRRHPMTPRRAKRGRRRRWRRCMRQEWGDRWRQYVRTARIWSRHRRPRRLPLALVGHR